MALLHEERRDTAALRQGGGVPGNICQRQSGGDDIAAAEVVNAGLWDSFRTRSGAGGKKGLRQPPVFAGAARARAVLDRLPLRLNELPEVKALRTINPMAGKAGQMHKSYFITEGELYVPTNLSRGYWVDGTITGSAIASLLACRLEQEFGEPGYVATRFSIDMLGLIRAAPLAVETRLLRNGRRLRLAEACIHGDDGQLLARASCQFVLKTQNPDNATWQAPAWDAPAPGELGPHLSFGSWDLLPIPPQYARIRKDDFCAPRVAAGNAPVLGPLSPVGARQAWFRPNNRALSGLALTPFLRAAMVADFVSPVANSSEYGIDYINTDFTLYLHREPAGEWIGLEMVSHHACDGIAIGECWLHDVAGPLGSVNLSATAQLRKKTGATPRDPEHEADSPSGAAERVLETA